MFLAREVATRRGKTRDRKEAKGGQTVLIDLSSDSSESNFKQCVKYFSNI